VRWNKDGLLGRIVFVTVNCDATFEHIEAAGADVVQEPINQPFGVRDCGFFDPSSNVLRFTRPPQRNSRQSRRGMQRREPENYAVPAAPVAGLRTSVTCQAR
jgi:hypothetical protein